jgi:hypothetical protein
VKKYLVFSIIFAFTLVFTQTGCSQTSEELKPIIEEMKVLRKAPARAAEFKEATITIAGDPFKGDKNAVVTLVDFTDYQ